MTATAPGFKADVLASEVNANLDAALAASRAEDAAIRSHLGELMHHADLIGESDIDTLADAQEAVRGLAGVLGDVLRLMRDLATDEQGEQ